MKLRELKYRDIRQSSLMGLGGCLLLGLSQVAMSADPVVIDLFTATQ